MMMSCLLFFPIVLFSMLAEGTIFAPYSANVVKSVQGAGDGWMLVYMLSFVIGLIAAIGISFVALNHWLAAPFAAAILVTITLIYFRLLGRLMWYSQNNLPQVERPPQV